MRKVIFNLLSPKILMFLWTGIKMCFEINSNMKEEKEWTFEPRDTCFRKSLFFSVVSSWLLMGKAMTTMLDAVMGSSVFMCLTSSNAYWCLEDNPRYSVWV